MTKENNVEVTKPSAKGLFAWAICDWENSIIFNEPTKGNIYLLEITR